MELRARGAVALVVAMAGSPLAVAQPDPPDAKPDAPPQEPEKDKPADPPVAAKKSVETPLTIEDKPKFSWEPFGFLRLQYAVVQNDPNVAFVGRDDGFQLQNARVGVRGELWRRARYQISVDGAVDEREQINVPDGKLRVGLRDAFVDVGLGSQDGWSASRSIPILKAGFFQTWAEPESQVPDTEREFVDRPIESRGIRATEGFQTQGLTPGRSLGAAFRFDPPARPLATVAPGFELAVQNGADEFASNNDNDKPAVSASALGRFGSGGYIVGSVRYNPRTVGALPAQQDETDLQATGGFRILAGPVAVGGGIAFVRTTFPTTAGPVQNAFGGHGQLAVRLGPTRLPFAIGYRFGIFDPSSLIVTDRVMEHTVGAVLGVPRLRMRVQLQLTHVIEQSARTLSNSRAQLAAEVAL